MRKFPVVISIVFMFAMPAKSEICDINTDGFKNFGDERLLNYILEGLNNNKDLIIAQKDIEIYRMERNKNIARLFPDANVGADYTLIKLPKSAIPSTDIQTNSFALPFFTVWEIDYAGSRLNKITKAKFDIKNACLDVFALNLSVAADVASAYFNISNLNKQTEIENKLIASLESLYLRTKKMYEYGTASSIELNNAEKNLVFEKNNLENLYKRREIFLTELLYLTGRSPYNADEIKVNTIDKIEYKGEYPEKFNGSVILNRPDILKLENELKKAKIDITIAKKEFLPKINVFGAMVFSGIVQNFGWKGVFAGLAAGATQNLFDGGRRIFNLKQAKKKYEKAVENYLKHDLNALKEVNDGLYSLKKDIEIYENAKKYYELEKSDFMKITNSYDSGIKSYTDLENNGIELLKKEMALYNAKNQKFIDLLTIYKATGGAM